MKRKATDRQRFHFPKKDGSVKPAATSWWVGLSRDELEQRAEAEKARMAASKFGKGPAAIW